MKHEDSHQRCLVYHSDCEGQCIKCTCGEYVRPDRWDAHVVENGTCKTIVTISNAAAGPAAMSHRFETESP